MSGGVGRAGPATALESLLRRRFRTAETEVQVLGRAMTILHPANSDDLIREEDFVRDERLPYWADLWPSSHALAARVAAMPGTGRRLLELGCGLGLVAAAAAAAGFAVTAADYYEDALLFARVNVRRAAGVEPATRHVDWRDFPEHFGTFDVVVASDVLYERPYGALVAEAFAATLAPGGLGLVADPGRIAAGAFVDACARRGMNVTLEARVPYDEGEVHQTIDIYEITPRPA